MKDIKLSDPVRRFLQRLVPADATIQSVRVGAYELEISYLTAGGQHARHELVKWAAVQVQELD
jgi:hypothetical protein